MNTPISEKILCFQETQLPYSKIHDIGFADNEIFQLNHSDRIRQWAALFFCCEGHGSLVLNENHHSLKKGDLFYIPAGSRITFLSGQEEPIKYYWISFYPSYAGEIRENLGFNEENPVRPAKSELRISQIFTDLLQATAPTSEVYFTALSSLMQILASEFTHTDTKPNSARNLELVANTRQIIEQNYTDKSFTIQDAANFLHINHPQMSRMFKEIVGKTPVSYLLDLRLSHAAKLLRSNPLSVTELCDASGFSNECHFMKQFKKKYGMTVKEYRASFRS